MPPVTRKLDSVPIATAAASSIGMEPPHSDTENTIITTAEISTGKAKATPRKY